MGTTKLELKNRELGKLVYGLRQSTDLHRIIGLNVPELLNLGRGKAFFGMVQSMALASIALSISKIFDTERGYELYSVSGVLTRLQHRKFTDEQRRDIELFVEKYGDTNLDPDTWNKLVLAVELFKGRNFRALDSLLTYRDKFIAHPEFGPKLRKINASHNDYEAVFEFANDLYRLVHESILGFGAAPMTMTAGPSFVRVLEKLGVEEPKMAFTE